MCFLARRGKVCERTLHNSNLEIFLEARDRAGHFLSEDEPREPRRRESLADAELESKHSHVHGGCS
jgi:hypothetical protein